MHIRAIIAINDEEKCQKFSHDKYLSFLLVIFLCRSFSLLALLKTATLASNVETTNSVDR